MFNKPPRAFSFQYKSCTEPEKNIPWIYILFFKVKDRIIHLYTNEVDPDQLISQSEAIQTSQNFSIKSRSISLNSGRKSSSGL